METYRDIIKTLLACDLGRGGYELSGYQREFKVEARSCGMLFGTAHIQTIVDVTQEEFFKHNPCRSNKPVLVSTQFRDGWVLGKDDVIAYLKGDAEVLLKAERTICNLLARLSGITTFTREQSSRLSDFSARLLDTRKSISIFREMDQEAFIAGGGCPHRKSMDDGILIKDNDIKVYGGIGAAVTQRAGYRRFHTKIEVEVSTLEQVGEVLEDGRAEIIMLDNMDLETMEKAVQMIRDTDDRILVEASGVGGLDLREVASIGVDYISSSSFITRGIGNPLDVSMKCIG